MTQKTKLCRMPKGGDDGLVPGGITNCGLASYGYCLTSPRRGDSEDQCASLVLWDFLRGRPTKYRTLEQLETAEDGQPAQTEVFSPKKCGRV